MICSKESTLSQKRLYVSISGICIHESITNSNFLNMQLEEASKVFFWCIHTAFVISMVKGLFTLHGEWLVVNVHPDQCENGWHAVDGSESRQLHHFLMSKFEILQPSTGFLAGFLNHQPVSQPLYCASTPGCPGGTRVDLCTRL